jgi:Dyp-type peroxidase family
VPRESLDSLAWEFRRGMVANAKGLGDTGESSPEHWERPLGTGALHVVIVAVSPTTERLEEVLEPARRTCRELGPGIAAIWRQDCHALPTEKEPFGFRDGVSHPAIEGSGVAAFMHEQPLKAGEFVLGYEDEMGAVQTTQPDVLGRNGTYVAFRKLHQRVAAFRRYLKENTRTPEEEETLAAKMMGRWRSGAPLALCPMHDDPELGADPRRRNDFLYQEHDPLGLKTPGGSHIRRMNPRDAAVAGSPRIHRMIRRGTVYGPPLPDEVMNDDGRDRGLMFAFLGAHLGRQFEFVQSEWINSGVFFGAGDAKDPIAGAADGDGDFTVPRRPVRRRLTGLPRFVVTRGGEYAFMPGLRALRWLSDPRKLDR